MYCPDDGYFIEGVGKCAECGVRWAYKTFPVGTYYEDTEWHEEDEDATIKEFYREANIRLNGREK